MSNSISLHEAALMLAEHNPDKGDYEFFKNELIKAVDKGELEVVHECNKGCKHQ